MTPVKAGSLDVTGDQSGKLIKVMLYIYIYIFSATAQNETNSKHPFCFGCHCMVKITKNLVEAGKFYDK